MLRFFLFVFFCSGCLCSGMSVCIMDIFIPLYHIWCHYISLLLFLKCSSSGSEHPPPRQSDQSSKGHPGVTITAPLDLGCSSLLIRELFLIQRNDSNIWWIDYMCRSSRWIGGCCAATEEKNWRTSSPTVLRRIKSKPLIYLYSQTVQYFRAAAIFFLHFLTFKNDSFNNYFVKCVEHWIVIA